MIRSIFLDIDGTLILGRGNPLPGAPETIDYLHACSTPFRLLTNDGNRPRERKCSFVTEAGIRVTPKEIISCSHALKGVAQRLGLTGRDIFVMGNPVPPGDYIRDAALNPVTDPARISECAAIFAAGALTLLDCGSHFPAQRHPRHTKRQQRQHRRLRDDFQADGITPIGRGIIRIVIPKDFHLLAQRPRAPLHNLRNHKRALGLVKDQDKVRIACDGSRCHLCRIDDRPLPIVVNHGSRTDQRDIRLSRSRHAVSEEVILDFLYRRRTRGRYLQ